MNLLSEGVKISTAVTPTDGVAAQTAIEGTILDMQGFDGVLMLVRMGTIDGSAVTSIKARSGDDSALSDAADLEGTSQTIADDDDDEMLYIDLFRPKERYVQLYVSRGTADAVVASAEYIQYNAREKVTSQGTGVSGESFVTPDEGTA